MGFNIVYITGNRNECLLQLGWLFVYFICDVNIYFSEVNDCMCGVAWSSRQLLASRQHMLARLCHANGRHFEHTF